MVGGRGRAVVAAVDTRPASALTMTAVQKGASVQDYILSTVGENLGRFARMRFAHQNSVQMPGLRHKVEQVVAVFEDLFALTSPESPFKR